jgi:hypothetical protein
MQEVVTALEKLQIIAARSRLRNLNQATISKEDINVTQNILTDDEALKNQGKLLLDSNDPSLHALNFFAEGFENSSRKVRILKLLKAYGIYRELIMHYMVNQVLIHAKKFDGLVSFQNAIPENKKPDHWVNVGGQLIRQRALDKMIADIHYNRVKSWPDIHQFYVQESEKYPLDKLYHALDIFQEVYGISFKKINTQDFLKYLKQSVTTAEWITQGIKSSRKKDYLNPFRKMVYSNQSEMDQVVGKFDDNSFIKSQEMQFAEYRISIDGLVKSWNLE